MAASGILRRIGIALGVEVDDKEARKDVDALKDFAKRRLEPSWWGSRWLR